MADVFGLVLAQYSGPQLIAPTVTLVRRWHAESQEALVITRGWPRSVLPIRCIRTCRTARRDRPERPKAPECRGYVV
jgi:hypothetical protein